MKDRQRLIQLIHIAKNKLQLDEDTYRQMLQGITGQVSTKSMNIPDLNKVLDAMKKKGFRISPAKKAQSRLPLDDHPQSRKVRALWLEMADAGIVRDRSENALARWIKRETGISALRWLNNEQASSVIEKLKKWQHRAAGVKDARPESVSK